MKKYHKFFSILFFILLSTMLLAQDEDAAPFGAESKPFKKQYYVFSPRVSITVPHPTSNRSFKNSFVGIYELSGGLNIMLYKGLFAGVTYKTGLLKVMENKIADNNTRMYINNVSVKVGGDRYAGDKNRMIFSAAVSAGKNWTNFSSLICKDPGNHDVIIDSYETTFIEPEINLFFLVEPNFGIGATISYTSFNRIFDPFEICLDDFAQFDKNSPGSTQYFSFGFGFYYSFLKKKS
ncbi:MAG: hypothetical protein ACT4ON_14255 [Bacteroidota bacterium]